MANTWNAAATVIARTGFKAFNAGLAPLSAFTSDFSAEAGSYNEAITTRIVPVSDAAVSLVSTAGSDRSSATHVIKDITTTGITVTLNQDPISGFTITDNEAAVIASGAMEDTKQMVIAQKAYAVANFILNYVFNLITNANFSTAIFTGAASTFDLDDVVDHASTLKQTHKWNLDMPTFLIAQPAYVAPLKKDSAVQDLSASGIPVVGTGELRRVDKFSVIEAPTLPPSGGTPESENLTAFYAQKPAISMAMRALPCQAADDLIAYEVMTDPTSGATLVYRSWYDRAKGQVDHTFEALFGASKGQAEALKRITSA